MGAQLTKSFNCCGTFKTRCKVGPDESDNHTDSEKILRDLRCLGLIQTTPGGAKFSIVNDRPTRPRTLPPIVGSSSRRPQVQPGTVYSIGERLMMAEIRREDILRERGTIGRTFDERRNKVIRKKNAQIVERIKKTENKLKKDEGRINQLIEEFQTNMP